MKIFNAELIIVYLVPHYNNSQVFHKHSLAQSEPQVFSLRGCVSVATDVIAKNQFFRLNSLHGRTQSNFNHDIDGSDDIPVKRILCTPLHDNVSGRTIGAITLLNKTNGDVFTEVDDLFAEMFAEHATAHIVSCYEFERLNIRCRMLSALLEASTDIFDVLPDQDSELATVLPGSVLQTLEKIAQNVLRCTKVKAFLSASALGLPGDELIILEKHAYINAHRKPPTVRRAQASDVVHIESGTGCVGKAIRTKKWLLLDGAEQEMAVNASVDMDANGQSMISVPILTAENSVLACLQLVPGPQSPQLEADLDGICQDNVTIAFEQALQWFLHQISSPLEFLLKYAGKPIQRPISTPKPLKDVKGQRIRHSLSMKRDIGSPTLVSMSSFFGNSSASLLPSSKSGELGITTNPSKLAGQIQGLSASLNDLLAYSQDAVAATGLTAQQQTRLNEFKNKVDDSLRNILYAAELKAVTVGNQNSSNDFLAVDVPAGPAALDELGLNNVITVVREVSNEGSEPTGKEDVESSVREELERKFKLETQRVLEQRDQQHLEIIRALEEQRTEVHRKLESAQGELLHRDQVISELEQSMEDKDSSLQRLKSTVDTLTDHLNESAASLAQYGSEHARLTETQAELTKKIVEKDNILGILQAQLVQMAESNLQDLDLAARNAVSSVGSVGFSDISTPPQSSKSSRTAANTRSNAVPSVPYNSVSGKSVRLPVSGKVSSRLPDDEGFASRTTSEQTRPLTTSSVKSPAKASSTPVQPKTPNTERNLGSAGHNRPYSVGQFAPGSFDSSMDEFGNSLPVNWGAFVDDTGSMYYYNDATGESSWESPAVQSLHETDVSNDQSSGVVVGDEFVIVGDWQQQHDENGQEYWVNLKTGVSEWSLPESAQRVAYAGAGVTPKGTKYDSYKIEL
jgi:hypothetical protein